jgi:hypothetical protein
LELTFVVSVDITHPDEGLTLHARLVGYITKVGDHFVSTTKSPNEANHTGETLTPKDFTEALNLVRQHDPYGLYFLMTCNIFGKY